MPDLKISQLPAATTPLAGTELVPVVQGGITERTTVGDMLTSTVPSGTANGVCYLDASKRMTSSGVLTFNGTVLEMLVSAGSELRLSDSSYSSYVKSVPVGLNSTLAFGTNATEGMRLISTGLGIGTSSPGSRLDVRLQSSSEFVRVQGAASGSGNIVLQGNAGSGSAWWLSGKNAGYLAIGGNGGAEPASGALNIDTNGNVGIGTNAPSSYGGKLNVYSGDVVIADPTTSSGASAPRIGSSTQALVFKTNSGGGSASEVARIDGSGNLGLGVTPSAWSTSGGANVETRSGALMSFSTTQFNVLQNSYYNGANYVYKNTAAASGYQQSAGGHIWYSAPSGTAGNAISFTQAMTLDASGRLMVKTTSASGDGITVGAGGLLYVRSSDDGTVSSLGADTGGATYLTSYKSTGGTLAFVTANTSGNNTERARFDSSGNFIHQVNSTAPALSTNSTMSFELTSNTSLKIVVRGTDGVTRSASLTLA
jgi:hypothetical protein